MSEETTGVEVAETPETFTGLDGSPFGGDEESGEVHDEESGEVASAEGEAEEKPEDDDLSEDARHWRDRSFRAEQKLRHIKREMREGRADLERKLEMLMPVLNEYQRFQMEQQQKELAERLPKFEDDPEGAIAARARLEAERMDRERQEAQRLAQEQAEVAIRGHVVERYRQASADPRFGQVLGIAAHGFGAHLEEAGIDAEDFPQYLVGWMEDQVRQGNDPIHAVVSYAQQVQQWYQEQQGGGGGGNGEGQPPAAPARRPGSAAFAKPSASRSPGKPLTVDDIRNMSHEEIAHLVHKGVLTEQQVDESWAVSG